eukprot:TRINITY_DN2724_c0_g1_i1.p1 TRINITY_DN2724_c0_g1~~TRINITY_DN2724_c0_g1_i1.p1  ORF type:complete len:214 (+),score=48.41 TRINITY_DN2724_c0_g1_i1:140-781(+)
MIQWTIVFGFLIVEIVYCTLLVLPFPLSFRKMLVGLLNKIWNNQTLRIVFTIMFVIISLLFADSLRSAVQAQDRLINAEAHITTLESTYKILFRHQRNSYISGFSAFLLLMLFRFKEMFSEIHSIETKSNVVVKQAENQQKEYLRLTQENEELKQREDNLKKELAERKKLEKELEAVKKQAANQQAEYMRMIEENNDLHKAANSKKGAQKKDD